MDHNLPTALRLLLSRHEIFTASYLGWADLANGNLIAEAERTGFDVLLTGDNNMWHQQNHVDRRIALVVLSTNDWSVLKRNIPIVQESLDRAVHGSYERIVLNT